MLEPLLAALVQVGGLELTIGARPPIQFGDFSRSGTHVALHVRDVATAARIALDPELAFGEAYMSGAVVLRRGSLGDLMELIGRNIRNRPGSTLTARLRQSLARIFHPANSPARSRRNVAHHYDLSESFYRLFLDSDMQYSCAYFADPRLTLEEAQEAKKAHIIDKLDIRPGQHVLDIGCGWGGLALSIARTPGVCVTGVTLSIEQLRVARDRAERAGVTNRVRFELCDFRSLHSRYDRIVSVGMFEHVGREHFNDYFLAIDRLLADEGLALVHSIMRKGSGPGTNPWIEKYIFPGGYIPAMSEVLSAIESCDLWTTDIEVLRLHYAETLKHWRERTERHRPTIEAMYGESFFRMWEFYLASCEMAFRYDGLGVFQIQIAKQVDALPITRDYLLRPAEDPQAMLA